MIRILKQFCAGALAASLLALTACQSTAPTPGDSSSGSDAAPPALGRYIESEYALPENTGYIQTVEQMPDGTIYLFCNLDPSKNLGPWKIFTSNDGGKRWLESDLPWLAQFDGGTSVNSAALDKDGNWYVYYSKVDPEIIKKLESGQTEGLENYQPESKLAKFAPDGTETELGKEFPRGSRSAGAQGFAVADNGDLLVDDYGGILQVDPKTMELKHEYLGGSMSSFRLPYVTFGDTLVIVDKNDLAFYSLTTYEKTKSVSFADSYFFSGSIAYDNDRSAGRVFARGLAGDDALYICDRSGIYRLVDGGAILERLVDGEMTSLVMPSLSRTDMVLDSDGGYTVFTSSSSYTDKTKGLLHFSYSKDTPTVPEQELKVYALRDNKTIRQAVGLFQRQNPDIHVIFSTGIPEDGSVLAADALRTLSMELLSGKGPDLLVLDGMPVNSYIEKGVLLDISKTVDEKVAAGEWLKNAASAFKQADGKAYAVPARFSVPMIAADPEILSASSDLTTLANALKAAVDSGKYKMMMESPFYYSLMELFYPIYAPSWQNADGSIDETKFRAYLTGLKALFDASPDNKNLDIYNSVGALTGSVQWSENIAAAVFGHLNTLRDIATPDAAITKRGSGDLQVLNMEVPGVYMPQTIVGVNANSKSTDAALKFLELVLSEQVQKNDFEDGLPVNAAAFQNGLKNPYPDFDDGVLYGTTLETGEDIFLSVKWATDAFMQKQAAAIQAQNVPFVKDEEVYNLIVDECKDYFKGTKPLDDTVSSLMGKLKLRLSE